MKQGLNYEKDDLEVPVCKDPTALGSFCSVRCRILVVQNDTITQAPAERKPCDKQASFEQFHAL